MAQRENRAPRLIAGVLVLALLVALGIAVVENIRQHNQAQPELNPALNVSDLPASPLAYAPPADWDHVVFVPTADNGVAGKRYDIFFDTKKFSAAQVLTYLSSNTLGVVSPPSGMVVVSLIADTTTQQSIERDVTIARNQGYLDATTYTIQGAQSVALIHQSGTIRLAQMKAGTSYYAVGISTQDGIVGKSSPIYQLIQSFH